MERNIHLIFKTHLDVGFTDLASVVVHNYFKKYIPAALRVARELRESGEPERFIWTTGSWLIYEYLEQAEPVERKEMETAILNGDIAWHALPFTTHTELMDAELFRFGLSLSQTLDTRFGKHTIAAKMTDVPGHTRAIIPLLAKAGVQFLHIGVNPGSTVPSVPGLFRWQDPQEAEVIVMYESGYGSAFEIPGLGESLAFGHTMDNMGPQSASQVKDVYNEIRGKLPGAHIFASTLSDFALKLVTVRDTLPVFTGEIGDTWIHGVGSDPIKVSRYRELLRLRRQWLEEDRVAYSDGRFLNFNRWLLMVPEHTWGMDEKTHLGDHENYGTEAFTNARGQANFKKFESSWVEKRAYPQLAVNALEDSFLAVETTQHLQAIRPVKPDLSSWREVTGISFSCETLQLSAGFNLQTGCISTLLHKPSKRQWVEEQLSFGSLTYQTFSKQQYDAFFNSYILPEQRHGWAEEDFTKPGMSSAEPQGRYWKPELKAAYQRQGEGINEYLCHLTFETEALQKYGAPADVYIKYALNKQKPELHIDVQWFNKKASRLPEALWYSFNPATRIDGEWWIDKMGCEISPLSVVENGNRHLHASGQYVVYRETNASLSISALDSPLVAPGQRALLDFNNRQPDMSEGMHFCLLNNLWGTNFPMWFEEDCRFRFEIQVR